MGKTFIDVADQIAAASILDTHLAVPYLKADGSRALTGSQDFGGFNITGVGTASIDTLQAKTTNGNLTIQPNGTGANVIIPTGKTLKVDAVVSTNSTDLAFAAGAGGNNNITLTPTGTGKVTISTSLLLDTLSVFTSNSTNLTLSGGSSSGSVLLNPGTTGKVTTQAGKTFQADTIEASATNGDLTLQPNGTGSNVTIPSGKSLKLTGATAGGVPYINAVGQVAVSSAGTAGQALTSGGSGAAVFAQLADGALATSYLKTDGSRALGGNWSAGNFLISNLANPVSAGDAVNKSYADALTQGLSWKTSVRLATAAALPSNTYSNGASGVGATLTATANAALTVDGTAVAVNDRILVKNEAAAANNGIYTVTATGSAGAAYVLTRATDDDTATKILMTAVFVQTGTANADIAYVGTALAPITMGTTSLPFVQFASTTAFTGDIALTSQGYLSNASGVAPVEVRDTAGFKISDNSGNGSIITGTTGALTTAGTFKASTILSSTFTSTQLLYWSPTGQHVGSNDITYTAGTNTLNATNLSVATAGTVAGSSILTAASTSWKAPVRAATTANITLTGTQTVDGVALIAGDRVLVKNQSTATQNGLYLVSAGSWTRTTDADTTAKVFPGMTVFVSEGGAANANTNWQLTNVAPVVLGSTSINFGAITSVAGDGLTILGATVSARADTTGGIKVNSGSSPAGIALKLDATTGASSGLQTVANGVSLKFSDNSLVFAAADAGFKVQVSASGAITSNGSGLSVNVTGSDSIDIASNAIEVKSLGIAYGKLAAALNARVGRYDHREDFVATASQTTFLLSASSVDLDNTTTFGNGGALVFAGGVLMTYGASNDYIIDFNGTASAARVIFNTGRTLNTAVTVLYKRTGATQ